MLAPLFACLLLGVAPAKADEDLVQPRHDWELSAGFTPLSYGFFDALGGDSHFDTFTTLPAAGLEFAANYHFRRYMVFGAAAAYVLSLGRTNYWSRDYEPGVHRFRLGPVVQFRVPGESVEPFLNLSGGLSALHSRNYGESYDAQGFYGTLGLGGNVHLAGALDMFIRYNLTFDHAVISSMDGGYSDYMEDAAVVAFVQEVTVGVLLRL